VNAGVPGDRLCIRGNYGRAIFPRNLTPNSLRIARPECEEFLVGIRLRALEGACPGEAPGARLAEEP
jgi:hypothetical protein